MFQTIDKHKISKLDSLSLGFANNNRRQIICGELCLSSPFVPSAANMFACKLISRSWRVWIVRQAKSKPFSLQSVLCQNESFDKLSGHIWSSSFVGASAWCLDSGGKDNRSKEYSIRPPRQLSYWWWWHLSVSQTHSVSAILPGGPCQSCNRRTLEARTTKCPVAKFEIVKVSVQWLREMLMEMYSACCLCNSTKLASLISDQHTHRQL